MAKGDRITTSSPNTAMTKIREMQAKWGLGQANKTYSAGNRIVKQDASDLYSWLVQGKSKSTWNGTVPTEINVTSGTSIKDIFSIASTTADQIKAYCPCNCNHCSCDCNRCSCDCNDCCTDGNNSF